MGRAWPTPDAREAERAALLSTDDLSPLLDSIGVEYARGNNGRKLLAPCPSPEHRDSDPSWFMNNDPDDERFGTHACSACSWRGGPVHFAYDADGGTRDWEEASRLLLELFVGVDVDLGRILDRFVRKRAKKPEPPPVFDLDSFGFVPSPGTPGGAYLRERGVSDFDQSVLGSVYAGRGRYSGRVILPASVGGKVRTFAARTVRPNVEPRYLYPRAPRDKVLWGIDLWKPKGKDVAIVEGILDAWAIRKLLGIPTYAVLGSRLSNAQAALLRTARSVTVVPDADDGGSKLVADAASRLPSVSDVRVARLEPGTDPADSLRDRSLVDVLGNAVLYAEDCRRTEDSRVEIRY